MLTEGSTLGISFHSCLESLWYDDRVRSFGHSRFSVLSRVEDACLWVLYVAWSIGGIEMFLSMFEVGICGG
jgi:hypothetical protein